jgi:predicted SnoaL-like aldol condensation-catalyzing enzyme
MFLLMVTPAFAGVPVTPAPNQAALVASCDRALAANKRVVFDFWRTVLIGRHLDQAATFLRDDYTQHNPNVPTGLQGFLDYFSHIGPPQDIPDSIPGLVTIRAEGDMVILAFVDERPNPSGGTYTTTWFDMFRIQDGKIAEHWDNATLDPSP